MNESRLVDSNAGKVVISVSLGFVSRNVDDKIVRGEGDSEKPTVRVDERLLVLYPGESTSTGLRVDGMSNRVVVIEDHGFPYNLAVLEISPRQACAPFNAVITVSASINAKPGVYVWELEVLDIAKGQSVGKEQLTLVILPNGVYKRSAKEIVKLKEIYDEHGIQVALWAALRTLYSEGAGFSRIRALYMLLTGRRVSKGTVGNTLKTMTEKGLLEKNDRLYNALDLDVETVLSRVDSRRVRYPWQVLKTKPKEEQRVKENLSNKYQFRLYELPKPIRNTYQHARKIAEKHGTLASLYFLAYSLLGARQTGYLLLWINGWFIILEPKTGFAHHFYSWLLHWMLRKLGLQEGVYYKPNNQQHMEAQKTAQKYIRAIYRSHQTARRLHYMLWEQGYIWSDNEVYTLKIYNYSNGETGLQILDIKGNEVLYEGGVKTEEATKETYTALPSRHVDKRNEETYHHRPGNIF